MNHRSTIFNLALQKELLTRYPYNKKTSNKISSLGDRLHSILNKSLGLHQAFHGWIRIVLESNQINPVGKPEWGRGCFKNFLLTVHKY